MPQLLTFPEKPISIPQDQVCLIHQIDFSMPSFQHSHYDSNIPIIMEVIGIISPCYYQRKNFVPLGIDVKFKQHVTSLTLLFDTASVE